MRIAKFWVDQMESLNRRTANKKYSRRFVAQVFYRTKGGRLNLVWNHFATYSEAMDFVFGDHYDKRGRKLNLGWDNKVRLGFTIEGNKGEGYKLLSYCLPFHVRNLIRFD